MSGKPSRPMDRVDGRLKVTGGARYAADYAASGLLYGIPVVSTIAKGRIRAMNTACAEAAPGVVAVISRRNAPKLKKVANDFGSWTKLGEARLLFADDNIHYVGQYVALVVADTLEHGIAAAPLVEITYEEREPVIDSDRAMDTLFVPKPVFGPTEVARGDVDKALATAAHVVDRAYSTPIEHHNPMEPSATVAVWNNDELTLYDATQWVMGARNCVADMFGIERKRVAIVSEFVGGGFGCKGFVWPHQALAALAAKQVGRPVKISLSRKQMYAACGHRPETRQHVVLGADAEGKLTAIRHSAISQTSPVDEHTEMCGVATSFLYACPNVDVRHQLLRVNIATPTPMRAPGENPGMFATESALDELSYAAGIDPLELRLRNYAETDPDSNLPFSGKHLRECYELGRDGIDWNQRSREPRSMRDGRWLIGYGMATATYPAYRSPGAAVVRIHDDGRVEVASATQDIGTGTYTTMTQITAEILGIPSNRIYASLGDSRLPPAPVSGGSMTTASVTPAVKAACEDLLKKLIDLASAENGGPFSVSDGRLRSQDGALQLTYDDVLRRRNMNQLEASASVQPGEEWAKFSFHSFGAQFAQVRVDPDVGIVQVMRMVSVFDIGRVLNAKTARSQAYGGIIQGIGMTLMEHTVYDERSGTIVNDNLADYLVPVNADVRDIDISFIDIPDLNISSIGARGMGEIAITGVAPAIANAVYHATAIRVRDLPITIEKLLMPEVSA
jgi:xanthine dehydrogenase YagR molybdenum-binding subunit